MKDLLKYGTAALLAMLLFGCGKSDGPVDPGEDPEEEQEEQPKTVGYVTSDEPLPILAWWAIPPAFTTEERYKELKDAGFNLCISPTNTFEEARKALDCAETAGVKLIFSCSELQSDTQNVVRQVKDHPALYGYNLRDEPTNDDFPGLAEWAARIREVDPEHAIYINLFPDYVKEGVLSTSYEDYVKEFIRTIQPPFISFDYYPVLKSGIRASWYSNLALIAREAEAAGLPFWAFSLITSVGSAPLATIESVRLQFYTSLAYGAQALQHFTYWDPSLGTGTFFNAPVNEDGSRGKTFDLVMQINKELHAREGVFVGAKVLKIEHTGQTIPNGTTRMTTLPDGVSKLDPNSQGIVVSQLKNGSYRYLMLVNRSIDKSVPYDIAFNVPALSVGRDGALVTVPKGVHSLRLDPGDGAIFRLEL